jgi:hypothetical protein
MLNSLQQTDTRAVSASMDASSEVGQSFLGWAAFPLPSSIAAYRPGEGSPKAKQLLAAALSLCLPRKPGYVVGGFDDDDLQALARQCQTLCPPASVQTPALSDDERSFDSLFAIARADTVDAFVAGVVCGLLASLCELSRPNSLVPAEQAALIGGFHELAEVIHPARADEHPAARPERPVAAPRPRHVFERWRNGHLAFTALIDGLILFHLAAIGAIERHDHPGAASSLRAAARLLLAAAAAMRLTGDMTPEDYDEVRAIMTPPRVPEGFSGLFNADHRQLLRLAKQLGQLLKEPGAELVWPREEYWLALNDAYSSHRWVCQKLVGAAPSLASASRWNEQPGPQKIEAFARRSLVFGGFGSSLGARELKASAVAIERPDLPT